MPILVDATHLRATLTGIERVTIEQFNPDVLAPLPVRMIRATGLAGLIGAQQAGLPVTMLRDTRAILLCPGFPPALGLFPFRHRVIPYISDTFLATRWADLNIRAKAYMAGPFRLAVARYPAFMVLSETTREALVRLCRPDAEIRLYRPMVRNVFEVAPGPGRDSPAGTLRLVALGTVEPRKNYTAAAELVRILRERGLEATLTIAGRRGWGSDWAALLDLPGVTLLGYSAAADIRRAFETADAFLSTSHEEGLGLPLLEAQHAGLPVVAPDIPVFREVLGSSGVLFDPARVETAADKLQALIAQPDWRRASAEAATRNLARWNAAAAADRDALVEYLSRRLSALA